jgi:hypothetical protein
MLENIFLKSRRWRKQGPLNIHEWPVTVVECYFKQKSVRFPEGQSICGTAALQPEILSVPDGNISTPWPVVGSLQA